MTKYGYETHFSLTIIFQENITKTHEEELFQGINNIFLKFNKGNIGWNEKIWQQASLFNPENPIDNEELGALGKIKLCEICDGLLGYHKNLSNERFNLKLFSHSEVKTDEVIELLDIIFNYEKTKKVHLLVIGGISSKGRISIQQMKEIVDQIKNEKSSWKKFVGLIKKQKFESNVNYEILKDQYY